MARRGDQHRLQRIREHARLTHHLIAMTGTRRSATRVPHVAGSPLRPRTAPRFQGSRRLSRSASSDRPFPGHGCGVRHGALRQSDPEVAIDVVGEI